LRAVEQIPAGKQLNKEYRDEERDLTPTILALKGRLN
jgi:hypothetical protein